MIKFERGSTWNKWDFHVHTPYSILNNQYGFVPDPAYKSDIDKFDEYVKILLTKAVENGVVAIGITDYFSIDGYKRIRSEYLERPQKMEELFPDETLRSQVKKIYIFPNIEFRISTFIGKNAHAVNYHVIFSYDIPVQDIETSFLSQLRVEFTEGSELPLCRENIERIGAEYKKYNSTIDNDYYVGLRQITVKEDDIRKLLSDILFKDKYLVAIPVDEDLSSLSWNGRDYILRKILYQQSHCFMTSNEKTRNWALGINCEEKQIAEFGALKPCIWGSDAHSYGQMFCPAEDRFCWIKAVPTFEGLRQIIYEPAERVRIQKCSPNKKDEHQVIDFIRFHDDDFQCKPIYFSEGLTAIIGGKSTGKSILLRHLAMAIDPKQVTEREEIVSSSSSKVNVAAEVVWKDGVSSERTIIYIPQSWLNHVVDESTGDSQLNKMFQNILLQQEEINDANLRLRKKVSEVIDIVKHNILAYVAELDKVADSEKFLHDFGSSIVFQSAIEKLEKQREELSAKAGMTNDELQKYTEVEKKITEHNVILTTFKKEEEVQLKLKDTPFVFIPQITEVDASGMPHYKLDALATVKDMITEAIQKMNQTILMIWESTIQDAHQVIEGKKRVVEDELKELSTSFQTVQEIISRSDQLNEIEAQLQIEKDKFRKAKLVEDTKIECLLKADSLMKQILESRQAIHEAYDTFVSEVSQANTTDSDLEFSAEIKIREQELIEAIISLFDNRVLHSFTDKYKYNIRDKEKLVIDEGFFENVWKAMTDGTLSFKGGNTFQTALERLFSDWFYVHYVVKSGTDTIGSMSPGKKALVLLEMIVGLEKSKCPILIDQPEDDLDNRSIYKDLVVYLKTKKHERQIIIVTHNANVVVGADAEEVIIANQDGKEAPNREKRFEYRSGAIEDSTPIYGEDDTPLTGILNQKGIQEQICDILEGGKDAFEKRHNKYFGMMK